MRSKKLLGLGFAVVLLVAFTAWAASPTETLLMQLLDKYMQNRFGETMKFVKALEPKVDKVKVDLQKDYLTATAVGSFKLLGQTYKAKYSQTWRNKKGCAYISDIDFETEMNPTVSDLGEKAMEALYANKCETDKNLNTAIRAAWVVKALTP